MQYHFNHLHMAKLSIIFTWDDNSISHSAVVAPIFRTYGVRCTFYVNPGEDDFLREYASLYASLSSQNFEVGCHGLKHQHLSLLPYDAYNQQITDSQMIIKQVTGIRPTTFAFPHHDYNSDMLNSAKQIYLETRNTLSNSFRFSLKSLTSQTDVKRTLRLNIDHGISTVFSGHAVVYSDDAKNMEYLDLYNLYEPITDSVLRLLLECTLSMHDKAEVCTFEQAALKEFIKTSCRYNYTSVSINHECLQKLESFGIDQERLVAIL